MGSGSRDGTEGISGCVSSSNRPDSGGSFHSGLARQSFLTGRSGFAGLAGVEEGAEGRDSAGRRGFSWGLAAWGCRAGASSG